METILVTGGAGFIGSHVCDKLLEMNKKVVCVDNFNNYYSPQLKFSNIKHNFNNPNFMLVSADLTGKDELEELIFKKINIDKIIHLAARAGVRPSIEKPLWYRESNIDATINLLMLAKQYDVKNFIFGSSSSVYGKNEKVPFSESDKTDCPISPYAASKKACEIFCYTYQYICDLNVTCLRFFTVYGPRGRPDMAIAKFTRLIDEGKEIPMFGDGTMKRDFTFVSDIVKGIVSALEKNFKYEIFNLGNSNTVELKYLISLIEQNVGKKAKIKKLPEQLGDVPITYADISKSKKLLGFEPKVKIEEGIKRYVEWYKSNKP